MALPRSITPSLSDLGQITLTVSASPASCKRQHQKHAWECVWRCLVKVCSHGQLLPACPPHSRGFPFLSVELPPTHQIISFHLFLFLPPTSNPWNPTNCFSLIPSLYSGPGSIIAWVISLLAFTVFPSLFGFYSLLHKISEIQFCVSFLLLLIIFQGIISWISTR